MKPVCTKGLHQLWCYPKASWAIYSLAKQQFIRNGPSIDVVHEFIRLTN